MPNILCSRISRLYLVRYGLLTRYLFVWPRPVGPRQTIFSRRPRGAFRRTFSPYHRADGRRGKLYVYSYCCYAVSHVRHRFHLHASRVFLSRCLSWIMRFSKDFQRRPLFEHGYLQIILSSTEKVSRALRPQDLPLLLRAQGC